MVTAFLIMVSVVMAALFPDVISYFKIVGGIFSVFVGKVVPTMLYFKLEGNPYKRKVITILTLAVGVLGISSVLTTIFND